MNIVNKLTLRSLLKNKRRTLVTIIGVIISVAMITGLSTSTSSIIKTLQVEHIKSYGEWHISYDGVDQEQVKLIKEDPHTKDVFLWKDLGFAELKDLETSYKPYLFFTEFSDLAFEKMPIELVEGRLPQNDQELLLSEQIISEGGLDRKLGDRLKVGIGDRTTSDEAYSDYFLGQTFSLRLKDGESTESIDLKLEKDYTIVGIMKKPSWEHFRAPGYTVIAGLGVEDDLRANVLWKKINKKTLTEAEQLGSDLGVSEIIVNRDYLRYFGLIKNDSLRISLYMLVSIIMIIIMLGSVALIYNAFAISVSERSRHLGMLSSIGATKIQKRNSVLFEGLLIGLISIPIGIVSGILGIGVTLSFVNSIFQNMIGMEEELMLYVKPVTILTAILISLLTIFISSYIPARRASRISAIDAIRQREDIKLTKKNVKTSKLVRKLFGFEAEIGLKNLKRNKKRYIATVFSLVISIVLFLSVTFFVQQIQISTDLYISDKNYDIKVVQSSRDSIPSEDLINHISILEEVEDSSVLRDVSLGTYLGRDQIHDQLIQDDSLEKTHLSLNLISLPREAYKKFAEEVGLVQEEEGKNDSLSGIVINESRIIGEKLGNIEPLKMDVGESLDLFYLDWDQDEEVDIGEIKIAGITKQRPLGVDLSYAGSVQLIVSEDIFNSLKEKYNFPYALEIAIQSKDVLAAHDRIEALTGSNYYIDNPFKQKQEEEGMILVMQIFTYGFISLITLVSVANIFNTISTSMALRRREFAMLKSVGMTPKGFRKMINYESLFYGIKALLYGLPLSIGIMYLEYLALVDAFEYEFSLPWKSIMVVVIAVFLIVGISMLYSVSKIRKENIIDSLKQENI